MASRKLNGSTLRIKAKYIILIRSFKKQIIKLPTKYKRVNMYVYLSFNVDYSINKRFLTFSQKASRQLKSSEFLPTKITDHTTKTIIIKTPSAIAHGLPFFIQGLTNTPKDIAHRKQTHTIIVFISLAFENANIRVINSKVTNVSVTATIIQKIDLISEYVVLVVVQQ